MTSTVALAPSDADLPQGHPSPDPKSDRLRALAAEIERLPAVARRRAGENRPRCSTGVPALDGALGGGLPPAAIHEFLARGGALAWSIALLTATRAAGRHGWILFLDTGRDFYAPAALQLGVPLERLLVIRVQGQADVLWTCEQALRCRTVKALIAPLRSITPYASRRLQLAAEEGGSLGLLLCREAQEHTFAATRLAFEPVPASESATGEIHTRVRVTVLKSRLGQLPAPFELDFSRFALTAEPLPDSPAPAARPHSA